eukprot:scaffold159100_cov16-Tisochrysis_lutea.AAC.2
MCIRICLQAFTSIKNNGKLGQTERAGWASGAYAQVQFAEDVPTQQLKGRHKCPRSGRHIKRMSQFVPN